MTILWTIAEQVVRQKMNAASPFSLQNGPGTLCKLGLYGVAGFMGVMAAVFAFIALYLWLLSLYAAPVAALLTSLTAFFAALLIVGGLALAKRMRKQKKRLARGRDMALVSTALAMVSEELEQPVKDYPKAAVGLAVMAGLMAGNKLHL
jgi:hypothetical protein